MSLLLPMLFYVLAGYASCFYGAVTLRQIKREQAEQNHRRRKLRKFLQMYHVHVGFRIVFLGVMIGLFCSYQTLDLPSVFRCGPAVPQTNTSSIPVQPEGNWVTVQRSALQGEIKSQHCYYCH
ncbi:hypothetical protein OS493_023370 [Desmophyllum pertusum]|uniref:Uncharacterized protein n=1 Tax=Desmophyllum pertusum TaxID=174260 RepID=A0A9X0D9K4_9CNID|nr:hypothetical protein OS493_023370 [Desmophyllum pertusum]